MKQPRNALDDPVIVTQIGELLKQRWDPSGCARDALDGGDDFYREQAIIVTGMLAADARETEVQRYLRQLEQRALPTTLHPMEERHAIAVTAWRLVRGLSLEHSGEPP